VALAACWALVELAADDDGGAGVDALDAIH
jgi:hypothetical protein